MPAVCAPTNPAARDWLLAWAERRLPIEPFARELSYPLAVASINDPIAVVVYSQWRGGNIEVTIAAKTPRWASRGSVAELLAWPFEALGVRRITAMVAAGNTHSRRLAERLGFRYEGYHLDWFESGASISLGLTRAAWRQSRWHRYRVAALERAA